jgi:hypothetical protein
LFWRRIRPQQHQRLGSQIQIASQQTQLIRAKKPHKRKEAFRGVDNIRSAKLALTIAYLFGELSRQRNVGLFDCDAGRPIARRAISAARARTLFSIEMPMSIAAVRAVIIGVTEEAG